MRTNERLWWSALGVLGGLLLLLVSVSLCHAQEPTPTDLIETYEGPGTNLPWSLIDGVCALGDPDAPAPANAPGWGDECLLFYGGQIGGRLPFEPTGNLDVSWEVYFYPDFGKMEPAGWYVILSGEGFAIEFWGGMEQQVIASVGDARIPSAALADGPHQIAVSTRPRSGYWEWSIDGQVMSRSFLGNETFDTLRYSAWTWHPLNPPVNQMAFDNFRVRRLVRPVYLPMIHGGS